MKKKEIVRRVMEKLGKKEKERRRKKKVMGFDSEEHIKDDHMVIEAYLGQEMDDEEIRAAFEA